ncbi:MAG: tetratricopeptide repeat protein [Alphaproteobacteria bacterium]|nr:tetratricopeptide repeat protein [Alphaproteobacteria bacterium]
MKYLLFAIILTGLMPQLVPQSLAAESASVKAEAQKYHDCIKLVQSNPGKAIKYANNWIYSGSGRVPAGHCKALGLLTLGKAKDAAILLEKLVDDMIIKGNTDPYQAQKDARLRIQLYIQTALAWEQADDLDKAYIAYSAALSGLDQQHITTKNRLFIHQLYLARGTLQILRGEYQAAIGDFTVAIAKEPKQFDGFLQRAKAYRKQHNYPGARLDLRVAQKLAPNEKDILLESGILYRETGDKAQAREQWQKIITLYPKSEFAKLARTNIDLLKPQL